MIVTGADHPGFYTRGRTSRRGIWGPPRSSVDPGQRPLKLMGIRKYRPSFLNRNWLKLYHVRHDASDRRYVPWSMISYSWRKALFLFQENMCDFVQCTLPYIPSLKRELIRMIEIVLGRGKWTCLKQNGKEQVKNIHNLMPHAWLSENCDVCFKIDQ